MAVITDNNHAIDMFDFDVNDLKDATFTRTDTQVVAVGTDYTYTFSGTGFGTGSGLPSSGMITGLVVDGNGTDTTHTVVTGLNVDVFDLTLTLAFGGSWVDVETLMLGGNDTFHASKHSDNLFGYTGNDTFDMHKGGADTVAGDDGNDTFKFGAEFTATDHVDGGAGKDKIYLDGDYTSRVTFGATTMVNVETMILATGEDYRFTTHDATVAAGKVLTVDASALGAADKLNFNGGAELDGGFVIKGGAGVDTIIGSYGKDTITGGGGGDLLTGGHASNLFVYNDVTDSYGTKHDIITGFDFRHDRFDTDIHVTGIDQARKGALNAATINSTLHTAFAGDRLAVDHASYFTATSGDLAGKVIVVINANGEAGYQANGDYVIQLDSATFVTQMHTDTFI